MVDLANWGDVPELKRIWRKCFGGPESYIDFYYTKRFLPEETLVWRENGLPISMLTMMNVTMNGENGCYIYAVATLPEWQNRGLMRALNDAALPLMKERGKTFSCLVPAELPLFPMYEKLGYFTDFYQYRRTFEGAPSPISSPLFFPATFSAFDATREKFLQTLQTPLFHPREELRYIFQELHHFSGDVLIFREEGKTAYVALNLLDDYLLVRETSSQLQDDLAHALLQRYGKEKIIVCSPTPFPLAEQTPYGMGQYFGENQHCSLTERFGEGAYMALMLD